MKAKKLTVLPCATDLITTTQIRCDLPRARARLVPKEGDLQILLNWIGPPRDCAAECVRVCCVCLGLSAYFHRRRSSSFGHRQQRTHSLVKPRKKKRAVFCCGRIQWIMPARQAAKIQVQEPPKVSKSKIKTRWCPAPDSPAGFNDRLTCDVALNLTLLLLNFDIEPRKDPSLPLRPNEKVILLILHLLPAVCLSQLICFGVDPRLWTPWYFPSLWWKKGSRQKLPRHSSAINRVSYQ